MFRVPARIAHARVRPRRNAFRYALCYVAISASEWKQGTYHGFFSIDRFNLFSLRSCDYGDGCSPPVEWIRGILALHGLERADGEIVLLTLPRLFGFAFNPVSFWFCLDLEGNLRAVIAEVNNTFGERHCYLCHHDDQSPISRRARLVVRKVFHVSPFMDLEGAYRFRFDYASPRIDVQIDLMGREGLLLTTAMSGAMRPLTALSLLYTALVYPLQTMKVVALIHYQALKLYLKGLRHYPKPPAPEVFVSR
jgi:uncharacterized protein